MSDIVRCLDCSSAIHEKEDCPYRGPAALMRSSGIQITARQMREMDDAARAGLHRGRSVDEGTDER